ncbi:MAG: hypothetical protein ABJR23_14105, partial [Paracoccaceae bacterium]
MSITPFWDIIPKVLSQRNVKRRNLKRNCAVCKATNGKGADFCLLSRLQAYAPKTRLKIVSTC